MITGMQKGFGWIMADPLWRTARLVALTTTLALVAALFLAPAAALTVLWDVAIPVLPAIFLVNPKLWRNICPLATFNMMFQGRLAARGRPGQMLPGAGLAGIVLLGLMVPARRFLFNENGPALAVTILAVAALALLLGARFGRKAGFCNSICPVLPVERLYGQNPLLPAGNAYCSSCSRCVSQGCIDLAPGKSIAQTLGTAQLSHAWLQTGFGAFAAGFPGFVLGYYLTANGPLATAGDVYLTIGGWTVLSYLLTQLAVRSFDPGAMTAIRVLGALAIGIYYWFVAAVVTDHLGLVDGTTGAVRVIALSLLGMWFWRARHHSGAHAA